MENTKHPKRFNDAVSKLYNAFHFGELEAMDCQKCAVGNLCNGGSEWMRVVNGHKDEKGLRMILETGYSISEVAEIESIFMFGHSVDDSKRYTSKNYNFKDDKLKETQFEGLCAVIEYLCELDNIPNIMDIQSLFETENDAPKKQLTEVLC